MAIDIQKNERETNQSLVRRFTKRLKESGILRAAKASRFYAREKGDQFRKHLALRRIAKRLEQERLKKLGK
ncbi:MAG: hypothetical protein HYV77_00510 [Candidatus Wildermuthbacteria bacterium]|nr:hypothetical protein [Candidatus Wildermuthbacteria bacterium]